MIRRRWLSVTLAVLSGLAALLATLGWWVHATLLDTERFMDLVDPIVSSPAVGGAVAERVTDEVFAALDLEDRVASSLTDVDDWLRSGLADALDIDPQGPIGSRLAEGRNLAMLTPALVGAAHDRVSERVAELVETPRFQTALDRSVRIGHRATVAILRSDDEAMPDSVVVDGDVMLDLRPLVQATLGPVVSDTAALLGLDPGPIPEDLDLDELADRLGITVDPQRTMIVLVEEEQLAPWRGVLQAFDRLVWVLVVLAIALAITAVLTARRRATGALRLGVAVAVAIALTWPLIGQLERVLLGRLSGPAARDTLLEVLTAATADLRVAATIVLAAALAVALAGWLVGRRRTAADPELTA